MSQVKFLIWILLLACLSAAQDSTNQSPNHINNYVDISVSEGVFEHTQYFTFQEMSPELYNSEWYAFLIVEAEEQQFWMKYHIYITTVSKQTGAVNPTKVECVSDHNDLHMCYFPGSEISIKQQNLKIDFVFQHAASMKIKVEINTVRSLQVGESLVMQRSDPNFTNILRIDVRELKEDFRYLLMEFSQEIVVDQFRNCEQFLASKEITPPDIYRYSFVSVLMWDDVVGTMLTYEDLEEVEYLTFLMGITDHNTYVFKTGLLHQIEATMNLQMGKKYHQIVDQTKTYHLQLPIFSTNTSFCLVQMEVNFDRDISLSDLVINDKPLNSNQIQEFLAKSLTSFRGQFNLKLDHTVHNLTMTLSFTFGNVFTLLLRQIDTQMVQLQPNLVWNDQLSFNQTNYMYFSIDTYKGDDTINFQVDLAVEDLNEYEINFRNCVQKSVQKCKDIALSTNQTLKLIGLTALTPKIIRNAQANFYLFKNLSITKYQISKGVYRSFFVIEMIAKSPQLTYYLRWMISDQIRLLKQNEVNKMHWQNERLAVYYFTVNDASNISFARVHYSSSIQDTTLFGSTTLIDLQDLQNSLNLQFLLGATYSFQNSITFTKLENRTTYYVYVRNKFKCYYEITLTFGHYLEGNIQHPISFLTIGETSKTELTIQPYQVLFVQIRTNQTFMILSNSAPLKLCQLFAPPKDYQDMKNSPYCTTMMTVNTLWLKDFFKTGKFYVGIQNENNRSSSLEIVTEVSYLKCKHVQMGKSHLFVVYKNIQSSYAYCVIYIVTHKADIQILIDIQNPKLAGIALPTIKLGTSWKTVMTSNIKILTGDEIDSICMGQYEYCWLEINFELDEDHHISQEYITVTASYTDQPLTLKDGLAHQSTMRPSQVKHFKYPLFSFDKLTATIKSNMASVTCYATIITNQDKFIYPEQEYAQTLPQNNTQIYQSSYDSFFYPASLTIPQSDILSKCNSDFILCYVLFSVYGKEERTQEFKFLIQVTQSISYLKEGQRLEKYMQMYSKTYFNFKNSRNNTNLLFFTGSSSQKCLSMDVIEGNSGQDSFSKYFQNGKTEIMIQNATAQWYSVIVYAMQNCYFTMQVSSSKKSIREVSLGYSHLISLAAGQKIYYIMPNHDLTIIKLIVSMKLQKIGEVIIRGIPVTDTELSDYIKFINNELEISKKSNLSYAWTDTNSLTIRQNDRKFCKNCHICIQIQASKAMEGYLTIPETPNTISFHLPGTTSSDILLKGQYYKWHFTYIFKTYNLTIKIHAGSIQIDMFGKFDDQENSTILSFDKNNNFNNQIEFEYAQLGNFNSDITITALQNSVYSISSKELLGAKDDFYYIQVGKPEYVYLSDKKASCYAGTLANQYQQFLLTISHSGHNIISAENVSSTLLSMTALVNSEAVSLNKEIVKNVIILSFDEKLQINNQPFKICLALKQEAAAEQYFDGKLMFLGNLNYLPEDFPMHFRKNRNLTFMSEGKGIIEVDQCGSRSVLTLNSKYQDINNMNSKITQRRRPNNLISFDHYGTVYLNTESKDFVTLRWRNYQYKGNGKGYEYFSPSTFRVLYDTVSQQLSVTIKPIQNTSDEHQDLLNITEVTYQVYVAKQQSDLYNAMNCEKGEYMFWYKPIGTLQEMTAEASMKLNNINDLKARFKNSQYVLVIVRAEVLIKWNDNNSTQNYRFYYPYQEMMLSQFRKQEATKQIGATNDQNQSSSQTSPMVGIIIALLIVVIVLLIVAVILVIRKLQNRVQKFDIMQEQQIGHSEIMTRKIGNEDESKMESIEMKNV